MSSQMQREMVIRSKQKALEHKRVLAVEFAKLALGSDEASGPGGLDELSEAEEKLLGVFPTFPSGATKVHSKGHVLSL